MNYTIKTVKTLETDNDKKFNIGQDIAFTLKDSGARIIGNIIEIAENHIKINDILVNENAVQGEAIVTLSNIVDNSCSYVYVN